MKTEKGEFGPNPLWNNSHITIGGEEFRMTMTHSDTEGVSVDISALPGMEWGGGVKALPSHVDKFGTNRLVVSYVDAANEGIGTEDFDIPAQKCLWHALRKPCLHCLIGMSRTVTGTDDSLMKTTSRKDRLLFFTWVCAAVVGSKVWEWTS